jgi:hypothetical protein
MRRFVTIPVVMVAVVLGAAVPALRAAAQLVDARVSDQLVATTDQLVGATADQLVDAKADQLVVVTADQIAAVVPGTAVELTGMMVDSACYIRGGRATTTADHAKCAIACAQKGGRLALVTDKGDVYMVIGALTQDNNSRLVSLINKSIVLAGIVGIRTPDVPPAPVVTKGDTRRQAIQDAVVTAKTVRIGDFREGDLPDASEMTIEPTAFKLVVQ